MPIAQFYSDEGGKNALSVIVLPQNESIDFQLERLREPPIRVLAPSSIDPSTCGVFVISPTFASVTGNGRFVIPHAYIVHQRLLPNLCTPKCANLTAQLPCFPSYVSRKAV